MPKAASPLTTARSLFDRAAALFSASPTALAYEAVDCAAKAYRARHRLELERRSLSEHAQETRERHVRDAEVEALAKVDYLEAARASGAAIDEG
jgi:hypothetical protein